MFIFAAFPQGCDSYFGPHSSECLVNLWIEEGCSAEGFEYFVKSAGNNRNLDLLNLKYVRNVC